MSVLLIGMMGAGKTTVGSSLAALLGWPYLDNDAVVRRLAGTALEELVATAGETRLRMAEQRALVAALGGGQVVAGVAGGVVLDPAGRSLLAAAAAHDAHLVVWLRARIATLAGRLSRPGEPARPWLSGDPAVALRALAADREPVYAQLAQLVVDVDGVAPLAVAAQVLRRVQSGPFSPG